MRRGFQIGGNLLRDALLRGPQQRFRQTEDPGAVGAVGIDSNPKQEADDQADTTERQANAQQRLLPARPF